MLYLQFIEEKQINKVINTLYQKSQVSEKMNAKYFGRKTIHLFLIVGLLFVPYQQLLNIAEGNPEPFFSISILAPNSGTARLQWHTLMFEQLPKIGIAVDTFDHTGWAQISPRTWGYPGPYPIPTYAEGGYDILFLGWGGGFDWDPAGLYDSPSIIPNGDNFYQYNNPAMDAAITSYTSSFTLTDRNKYAGEIQSLLYEDLPQISIIYSLGCYSHDPNITNFEALLWAGAYYPFHNLSIPGQTSFTYATPADFEDFHPFIYESVYDAQWLLQIYNGLLQRDPILDNSYGPWLAESVSSTDGVTYDVVIKDDACWADGVDLTTDDIIYNYQLAVNPSLNGISYSTNIKYWDNDSITKINDKEFSITFKQSYVFQDNNLALNLLPEHIWSAIAPADHKATSINWTNNYPEKMFGAGPYMLADYDATNRVIHLTANPQFADWFGAAPSFDDIYFEFFNTKVGALAALSAETIDMVDSQFSPQIAELAIPNVSYTLVDDPGIQEIAINMEHPYLGTGMLCPIAGTESAKHIRKAISYMVPRQIIVNEILNGLGVPATTGCPRVAVGYNHSLIPYEYDIELAKYHMNQAGFEISYTLPASPNSYVISLSFSFMVIMFGLLGVGLWITRKNSFKK